MTTPPNSKADRPNMAALVTSWRTYSILHGFYTLKDRQGRRGNDQALGPAQQSTIAEVQAHATRVAPTGPTPDVPGDAPFRLAFLFCKDAARPPKNALAHACQREHWFWQQAPD